MSAVKTISAPHWSKFEGKGYLRSKDDSASEDYGRQLPDFFKDVAKEQLREDEEMKKHSLNLFRDWISQNPDIRNIRTGKSWYDLLEYIFQISSIELTICRRLYANRVIRKSGISFLFQKAG